MSVNMEQTGMAKKKADRTTAGRKFWLFKSEPNVYSIDDLAAEVNQTTFWDGIRNYQARNMLRDEIQVGDGVFFYYSRIEPMGIAGTMQVIRAGYPDHTAFDATSPHYDPKSDPAAPTWFMVDVRLSQTFSQLVIRDQLKALAASADMMVLRRGSRLSIQPVTAGEWRAVHKLAGCEPD
jgi:predicted RNA-binding protein with PUA-like domain